ncbi:hypothetical protein A2U01_0098799, partial [Trifolium medium]|nr:hypothetical protein [Trifolium medium]
AKAIPARKAARCAIQGCALRKFQNQSSFLNPCLRAAPTLLRAAPRTEATQKILFQVFKAT